MLASFFIMIATTLPTLNAAVWQRYLAESQLTAVMPRRATRRGTTSTEYSVTIFAYPFNFIKRALRYRSSHPPTTTNDETAHPTWRALSNVKNALELIAPHLHPLHFAIGHKTTKLLVNVKDPLPKRNSGMCCTTSHARTVTMLT